MEFIKEVVNKISKNNNWSILIDNARIHYYQKFKNYINGVDNINIIYNVPYSPESNPIENVFKEVKKYLKDVHESEKLCLYFLISSIRDDNSLLRFITLVHESIITNRVYHSRARVNNNKQSLLLLPRVPINNSNIIREINKSFNVLKNDNVNEYFKKSYNFY